jgi:hypothetical protein
VFFLSFKKKSNKIKINMVILVFKGSEGKDFEVFLREYKTTFIGTGLKTIIGN